MARRKDGKTKSLALVVLPQSDAYAIIWQWRRIWLYLTDSTGRQTHVETCTGAPARGCLSTKTTPWLHLRTIGKIVSHAGLIDLVVFAPVISRAGALQSVVIYEMHKLVVATSDH